MKKRILSFVMALVLAVSLLPAMSVPASAADVSTSASFTITNSSNDYITVSNFLTNRGFRFYDVAVATVNITANDSNTKITKVVITDRDNTPSKNTKGLWKVTPDTATVSGTTGKNSNNYDTVTISNLNTNKVTVMNTVDWTNSIVYKTITVYYTYHTHSYAAATCTTPKKCSCGATSGNALGHDYSSKTVNSTYLRSAATCTAAATYYYKCSRCTARGTNYYSSGNALGHDWTAKNGICKRDASHVCSHTGYATAASCGICGKTLHTHNFIYEVPAEAANTIEVTCGNANCFLTDSKATLSLTASNATYSGVAVTASFGSGQAAAWKNMVGSDAVIKYKGRGNTTYTENVTAPMDAGEYTAFFTAGGQTASVDFTISKASENPTVELSGWTYGDETEHTPVVYGNTSGGTVSYKYKVKDADDSTYSATQQPTQAGIYTVKAEVAETANYTAASATADFTIAKADYTVTAPTKAENLVYTGSDQALLAAAGSSDGTMKYSLDGSTWKTDSSAMKATNAGEYTVWYKVDGDDNHNPTSVGEIKVTIAKANSQVAVAPEAKQNLVYNGTEQELVTRGSAVGGTMEYMEYSTDGQNYTDSVPVAIDAGTYTVWYKVKGDANHNDTDPDSVEVTIGKADATDEMKAETAYLYAHTGQTARIELDPLPDASAKYGTPNNSSENETYFTLSAITENNRIGTITATAKQQLSGHMEKTFTIPVTDSKNYKDYSITVTLHLEVMPVQTITGPAIVNAIYGDTGKSVSVENTTQIVNNYPLGDISYHVLQEDGGTNVVEVNSSTGALTIKNAGTAYIVAKAALADHYAPSEPHYITVNVAPKTLTSDMLDLGTTSEHAYSGTMINQGYTVKDGTKVLDHYTDYALDIDSTTGAINAGSYTIKIDGMGNYTESVSKTWKINKKNATMAAIEAHPNLVYTGSEHELVIAGNPIGGEVYYKVGSSGTYSMDVPKATNAGIYTVHYYVKGDNNHNNTTEASVNVTIAKATPVITTKPAASAITYGQTLASSALIGGVANTYGTFSWKEPTAMPIVAHSDSTYYVVKFVPADTANYNEEDCDITLTVNKKPVSTVLEITAPKPNQPAQVVFGSTDDFEEALIVWSPELKDGKFEYNKEYTATLKLTLKDPYNTTTEGAIFSAVDAKDGGITFDEEGNLTVTFKNTGSAPSSASSNSITAPGSAENGEVSVDKKSASAGQTVTITVTPDKGYTLETLTVTDAKGNEVALTKVDDTTYTFKMPNGKVNVDATFMEDNTMLNYFVDVPVNEYYYDAVLWAVSNGITNGTDDTHFSPNMGTTRAHVVTFLWRAAGCPEPKGDASQFTDVVAGEYYEKAVAWAIENGITKGTSATTFSPDAICTRGQIVTFLARFAGVKDEAVGYTHGFTDVNAADYFNNAVAWAKDNKITEGTTATTFSPYEDCTRAQVVTFLYRLLNK